VIRITEDDPRTRLFEVAMAHRLDASLRSNRHERGRLNDAVRRTELAEACGPVGVE
jgi:hypothetical protein